MAHVATPPIITRSISKTKRDEKLEILVSVEKSSFTMTTCFQIKFA
jgi:hypothetical protein